MALRALPIGGRIVFIYGEFGRSFQVALRQGTRLMPRLGTCMGAAILVRTSGGCSSVAYKLSRFPKRNSKSATLMPMSCRFLVQ